jgi:hypothetical protein
MLAVTNTPDDTRGTANAKQETKVTTLTKDRLVAIQWLDASQHEGYFNADQLGELADNGPLECVSVGYLVSDTDDCYILAQTRNLFRWGDLVRIPKVSVTAFALLSPPDNLIPNWAEERETE